MADEDTILEEAMDNLKEAGQRIRATQSLMRSQDMSDGENHRDLTFVPDVAWDTFIPDVTAKFGEAPSIHSSGA